MITYDAQEADSQAQLIRAQGEGMGTWEYMWRTAAHTFGAFNTIGQAVREADFAEHGDIWDMYQATGLFDDAVQLDPQALRDYAENAGISREEFSKTREEGGEDLSRGGRISWFAGMTKTRARLQALELDRRDREAAILNQNSDGVGRTVAGFGAAMMAVMLDPINMIPVGGAATKGMRTAQRIGSMSKAGVKGALLADAFLLPRASAMGEDVGPETAFLDTIFGAAFGAGMGAFGAAWHGIKRRKVNKEATDFLNELTEAGIEPAEAKRIAESYYDVAVDFGRADREMLDTLRRTLSIEERKKFGLLMDRAIAALANDEPMDVGDWAERLGLKEKLEQIYTEVTQLREGYDFVLKNPIAEDPSHILAAIGSEDIEQAILVQHGPAIMAEDGSIKVWGKKLLKAKGSSGGYGMVKIMWRHGERLNKDSGVPPVTREDVINLPYTIRRNKAYLNGKGDIIWDIPIEGGLKLVIVAKRVDEKNALVSMYKSKTGSTEEPDKRGPFPYHRLFSRDTGPKDPTDGGPLAPRNSQSSLMGYRDGRPFQGGGTANNLGGLGEDVNAASREARMSAEAEIKPDFRTEREINGQREALGTREREENIFMGRGEPSVQGEASAAYDPMERAYAQMEAEGSVAPEDSAAVNEALADVERAERLEEAALDVFECALQI